MPERSQPARAFLDGQSGPLARGVLGASFQGSGETPAATHSISCTKLPAGSTSCRSSSYKTASCWPSQVNDRGQDRHNALAAYCGDPQRSRGTWVEPRRSRPKHNYLSGIAMMGDVLSSMSPAPSPPRPRPATPGSDCHDRLHGQRLPSTGPDHTSTGRRRVLVSRYITPGPARDL